MKKTNKISTPIKGGRITPKKSNLIIKEGKKTIKDEQLPPWLLNVPNTAWKFSEKRYDEKLTQLLYKLFRTPSPYYGGEAMMNEDLFKVILLFLNWFKIAMTTRYFSIDENSEILEFVGDKIASAVLADWLEETFPDEKNESSFSEINTKFVSKPKMAEYSDGFGFYPLIRKPKEFEELNHTDREDACEAFIGALFKVGENIGIAKDGKTLTKYSGKVGETRFRIGFDLVRLFLTPIWIKQEINPKNINNYKNEITLLKEGHNVFYNGDPIYKTTEIKQPNGKGGFNTFYIATVYKRIPTDRQIKPGERIDRRNAMQPKEMQNREFKTVPMAKLEGNDIVTYGTSKSVAEARVAYLALKKEGWTPDVVREQRIKKDKEKIAKFVQEVKDNIIETRRDALKLIYGNDNKKRSQQEEDVILEKKFGINGRRLELPPEITFYSKFIDGIQSYSVVLYAKDPETGDMRAVGSIFEKKAKLPMAYRRLNKQYIDEIRMNIGLDPIKK